MVPSSLEGVTRAMRGEADQLSSNNLRRNGGKCEVIFYVFIFKRRFIAEMFSVLSCLFVRLGFFFLLCACLAVHSLAVYLVLGIFK